MQQVSGRAGRRKKHGKVIIQTFDPGNKLIRQLLNNDYHGMFTTQMEERRVFNYPPWCRMIRISLKHTDRAILNEFSDVLGRELRDEFGGRVLGPEYPAIARIQGWHIRNIIIKIEKEKPLGRAKEIIRERIGRIEKMKGAGGLRIIVDVDP
jgi:primosomal protein N' (replication factor Y)